MLEYCVCTSTSRGWSLDTTLDLWVCTECKKPSKAIYERATNAI